MGWGDVTRLGAGQGVRVSAHTMAHSSWGGKGRGTAGGGQVTASEAYTGTMDFIPLLPRRRSTRLSR